MKHLIPELELEQIHNLADITFSESSNSVIEDKIRHRRMRVNQLRIRGYTNQQIADKIGCNLSTIEKDLHAIRQNERQWYEKESITEYCQSIHDSIILYDNLIEDLQILYADCNDLDSKLKILSKLSEFEDKKSELYSKTKSIQDYLRRLEL